jgi:hypothetical protein
MDLEVKVTNASLADVVEVAYDHLDETVEATTLGDVIARELVNRLTADPRWDALAQRAIDKYLAGAVPAFIEQLAGAEVARQLESRAQGAMTRGTASTRAEAIVATEVTTQLRAQFAPVVEQALAGLRGELETAAREAAAAFRADIGKNPAS